MRDISAMQKLGFIFKEMRIGFLNGLLLGSASFVVIGIFVHIMKQKSLFFSFALSGCVGISSDRNGNLQPGRRTGADAVSQAEG